MSSSEPDKTTLNHLKYQWDFTFCSDSEQVESPRPTHVVAVDLQFPWDFVSIWCLHHIDALCFYSAISECQVILFLQSHTVQGKPRAVASMEVVHNHCPLR